MTCRNPRATTATALLSLLLLVPCVARAGLSDPPRYRLTDLGSLVGGRASGAAAVNDAGQVVGNSDRGEFLYDDGRVQRLGTADTFAAGGINNSGQVVGSALVVTEGRAALWEGGRARSLDSLGGQNGFATAINGAGQVVGGVDVGGGDFHAFLWEAGRVRDLGVVPEYGHESRAAAINERGQVVGSLGPASGDTHAFLWEGGVMRGLGTLPGDTRSRASAINDRGQAAGVSGDHAVVWEGGAVRDLGRLPGRNTAAALGINHAGQVVGFAVNYEVDEPFAAAAFLYADGRMHDLNDLVAPGSGLTLEQAVDINNAGQIVGYGISPEGEGRAFLLTPVEGTGGPTPAVPLPPALWAGLITMAGMAVAQVRRRLSAES